jgi:hypothetical protein
MRGLAAAIILILSLAARAQDLTIVVKSGEQWALTDAARAELNTHLANEISQLKKRLPGFCFSPLTSETKMSSAIPESFFPGSKRYKNRDIQCAFIQKLISRGDSHARARARELSQDGKLCSSGDIAQVLWPQWTFDWMQFLWNEKWFPSAHGNVSLEDIIISKIGRENYRKPSFHIALLNEFDGFGWGFSANELRLFASDPVLRHFRDEAKKYDPNSHEPFMSLGPIVFLLFQDSPYSAAGFLHLQSEIWISPGWPVAELVELLMHEYGHVLHGEQDESHTWNSQTRSLEVYNCSVQDEAISEAFSEMSLREVFARDPETKLFHVGKLALFSIVRPTDPHYVGAGAIKSLFWRKTDNFGELFELIRSHDFAGFLKDKQLETATQTKAPHDYRAGVMFGTSPQSPPNSLQESSLPY